MINSKNFNTDVLDKIKTLVRQGIIINFFIEDEGIEVDCWDEDVDAICKCLNANLISERSWQVGNIYDSSVRSEILIEII